MPPKTITFIRHGEAAHNAHREFHLVDPSLTTLGESQCRTLSSSFLSTPIDLIVTSPIKRTLQTTTIVFAHHLSSTNPPPIVVLPHLREVRRNICDHGSKISDVEPLFRAYNMDWSIVEQTPEWTGEEGYWGALDDEGLKARGRAAREWLWGRSEENVVVIGHGAFVHYLTDIFDMFPGRTTGWVNCEARKYRFLRDGESGEVRMVRVETDAGEKVDVVVNEVEVKDNAAVVA